MPTDGELARAKYRKFAAEYDQRGPALAAKAREILVGRLDLRPGDVVLDVACGTGLSFPLIRDRIAESGHIIGVDLSPEMLERARERVATAGWENVTLVQGSAEEARFPRPVDALLFCLTHDVIQSPRALENLFRSAIPGARVAVFGPKWAPWWAAPMNVIIYFAVRKYTTTHDGLSQPWAHLARFVPDLRIETQWLGSFYTAWGKTTS